jgi:hypothetical protein
VFVVERQPDEDAPLPKTRSILEDASRTSNVSCDHSENFMSSPDSAAGKADARPLASLSS